MCTQQQNVQKYVDITRYSTPMSCTKKTKCLHRYISKRVWSFAYVCLQREVLSPRVYHGKTYACLPCLPPLTQRFLICLYPSCVCGQAPHISKANTLRHSHFGKIYMHFLCAGIFRQFGKELVNQLTYQQRVVSNGHANCVRIVGQRGKADRSVATFHHPQA